ncbi:MAG: ribosomal protein S19 family protein [Candidatus Hodgkinia cicadicola]
MLSLRSDKLNSVKLEGKNKRKVWNRSSNVEITQVGTIVELHNGKRFVGFKVTSDMIGHKLGEFVATRKQCSHNR